MEQFGAYYLIVGVLIILDIISGVVKAMSNSGLDSTKLRQGLYHKVAYIIIMALATALQVASGSVDLGYDVPLVAPCAIYIVITEVVSIVENVLVINPELNAGALRALFEKDASIDEREEDK